MTALAGCIGASEIDRERACADILQAQHNYGGMKPRTASLSDASFGIALRDQLPEDSFDRQPFVESNRFMLVADVRLDNRDELASDMGLASANLADSDLLFQAWMRWGEASLDRLVGDFAFALWDPVEQRLVLARDATGQRPLFYWQDGERAAFASMPGGLLALPFVRSGFRFEMLATELLGISSFSEATCFDGIFRVLPGHFAVIDGGRRPVQKSYWNPQVDFLDLTDGEFVDAYREEIERALRPTLRRKSGAIGVHLSSGLDSSAVAATAAQLCGAAKPVAFTSAPRLGFDGPVGKGRIGDESALAALTAKMHGLEHVVVRPTGGALGMLRDHAHLYQEPNRNIVNMKWWSAIHHQARERGVSTLLTGQMGNFGIHAGGLPVLAEWVQRGDWLEWWREARAAVNSGRARWRGVLMNSFEASLDPRLVRFIYRLFLGAPSDREQSYLQDRWLQSLEGQSLESARQLLKGGPYERRLALIRTEDIGVHRKGALAESGIDERDPLANRRLIDFSFRLPPSQLLHRGEWRPLAKRALAGRLPDAVLNANLRGYQGADWFERASRAEALAIVEEIATSTVVTDLLDLQKIRRDIDRWPAAGAADLRSQAVFRARLTSALSTGVFLLEFEPLVAPSVS
jgi:asparagine synthase (glutamine-hydrolysing)